MCPACRISKQPFVKTMHSSFLCQRENCSFIPCWSKILDFAGGVIGDICFGFLVDDWQHDEPDDTHHQTAKELYRKVLNVGKRKGIIARNSVDGKCRNDHCM